MSNGWSGAALPPPQGSGVTFAPGVLAVGTNQDGHLEIFAVRSTDGTVWHRWQVEPNAAGGWSEWEQLAANPQGVSFLPGQIEDVSPKTLVAATNSDGRLEIFAISSTDGNAYHIWQNGPNGAGGWSGNPPQWTKMTPVGFPLISLDVAMAGDGQLLVVYFSNLGVSYDFQTAPASGPWNSQVTGTVATNEAAGNNLVLGTLANLQGASRVAVQVSPYLYWFSVLNNLSAAAGAWGGVTPGPGVSAAAGALGSAIPPTVIPNLVLEEWQLILDVDKNGNLAVAQIATGPGAGWSNFTVYAGPGKGQTQFQPGLLAAATLPVLETDNGEVISVRSRLRDDANNLKCGCELGR
jgi:hypothetical protein